MTNIATQTEADQSLYSTMCELSILLNIPLPIINEGTYDIGEWWSDTMKSINPKCKSTLTTLLTRYDKCSLIEDMLKKTQK